MGVWNVVKGAWRIAAGIARAIDRALPDVQPVMGPPEDRPGERSVLINGRRVVLHRETGWTPLWGGDGRSAVVPSQDGEGRGVR